MQIAQNRDFHILVTAWQSHLYMPDHQQTRLDPKRPRDHEQGCCQQRDGNDSDPGFSAEQFTGYLGDLPCAGSLVR